MLRNIAWLLIKRTDTVYTNTRLKALYSSFLHA